MLSFYFCVYYNENINNLISRGVTRMENLSSLLKRNYSLEDSMLYDRFISEQDYTWEQLNELTDSGNERFGLEKLYALCALDGIKIKGVSVSASDSRPPRTSICYEYKWIPSDGNAPRWDTGYLVCNTDVESRVIRDVICAVRATRHFLKGKKVNEL